MSDLVNSHHHDDLPRFDAWVGVLCSAFVPVTAALFLPPTYLVPLLSVGAVLFGAGLAMAFRRRGRHGSGVAS